MLGCFQCIWHEFAFLILMAIKFYHLVGNQMLSSYTTASRVYFSVGNGVLRRACKQNFLADWGIDYALFPRSWFMPSDHLVLCHGILFPRLFRPAAVFICLLSFFIW